MQLINLTKKLASFGPDGSPFLSIYAGGAANDDAGREADQIWVRSQFSETAASYDKDELQAEQYSAARDRVLDYIENETDAGANGTAIFISIGENGFFEAVQLEVSFPENVFHISDRPHIFPLVKAVMQNPKYAVLWADTNKADIYIFGGENRIRADVDVSARVENIQNRVTRRSQVGGWSQGRYQRHIENFHLQHAKETVAELEDLMRKENIEHLVLCGNEATIMPVLRQQLSKPFEEKVIGTLNLSQYDLVDDIQQQTEEIVAGHRIESEKKQVERVFDAANAAAGLGSTGYEATLKALSNGQVQELVLTSNISAIEFQPLRVEKILDEYSPGDDNSPVDAPESLTSVNEAADLLLVRALNSDAEIIFVDDAELLEPAGGVAAVLRYSINATANG